MKYHSIIRTTVLSSLLPLTIAGFVAQPLPSLAASLALADAPLATSTTAKVKPNIMFILDDSGSMDWNYLPDWATDTYPTPPIAVGSYTSYPPLHKNNGFNGVAYNPAVTYLKPVHFNSNGTVNTTTYPDMLSPWTNVKRDGYGIQSTATDNLVGNASHYVFVFGEYCSNSKMTSCVTSGAPITISGVIYDKLAKVRWCDSSLLTNCQSINNSTFKYPRYPTAIPWTPAKATLKVTNGGTATSIKVNGFEILSGSTTSSGTESTVASRIRDNINDCTSAITGSCTIAGYSASRSGDVVTITAPVSVGAITVTAVATGTMSKTITAFSGGIVNPAVPGSNILTDIVSGTNSYPYPGTASKAPSRTDCAGATCTYAEEMNNYANWWAYYHTRMQSMKTAVSRSFKDLTKDFRVGFSTISNKTATNGTTFLGNDTFELAHKNSWYSKLFAAKTPGWTPLRGALSKAGRYYAKKITGQVDPVQFSCQQNFTILSTDGYWNTNDETTAYGPYNLSGGNVGNMDADASTARPMKEGTTATSNTLADVAKYYYDTDLRTGVLNNCTGGISSEFPSGNPDVCTNNVFISPADNNQQQHMTTFTLGLGADGMLNYTTDYDTATSGDFYDLKKGLGSPTANWPNPIANTDLARIDDLWHAAVNGRGAYFSAKNPDDIIDGLTRTLTAITAKLGSAAAAATSTLNPVPGNNFAYVASYTTVTWKGNLESRSVNTITGEVSKTANWCVEDITASTCSSPNTIVADSSGSSTVYNCVAADATAGTCASPGVFDSVALTCSTPMANACTGTMSAKVAAATDTRTIYTPTDAGTALTDFDATYAATHTSYFDAARIGTLSQWATLDSLQRTAATGENLINFLRGQTGFEDRTSNLATKRLYRYREAVLGDALESQPAFMAKPVYKYIYPGYSDYVTAQASRAGTVYMGTNDGMLHAFASDTGIERWAYVPSMVIPNMWKLADTSYSTNHRNYVNGSPITNDICTADCTLSTATWKTILVGGLNGGGRGYYALDITNPATPTLLWEFTPSTGIGKTQDDDLGYSYGLPVITRKADGTWVVLVTSGYNNTSPGSGQGYLYVLNAGTGAIISKISTGVGNTTTPSGLNKVAVWNEEAGGNKAGYVYGGDLLGNLWRFDINSATAATIGTGDKLKFATLFSNAAATIPQPVTTTPILADIEGKRVIIVGTGKYLETSDLSNANTQSLYAIKDHDETSTLVNPRTTLVNQTLVNNIDGTATRTSPGNTVDFINGRGWYIDLPDISTDGVASERVNIDGKLVQGTLLIATIVPSSTVCSPGGYGWLNYLNYKTGAQVGTSIVSEKFDATIVGINVLYIDGKPIVSVVTSDDPTPKKPLYDVPFDPLGNKFQGKRSMWRELIPQ